MGRGRPIGRARGWRTLLRLSIAVGLIAVPGCSGLHSSSSPAPEIPAEDTDTVSLSVKAALAAPIVTITAKPQPSPTGDPHDYVSYARYWWPDPTRPEGLPFIRKDGHVNRAQLARGDRNKLDELATVVHTLASGWHLNRNTACAVRAGEWLRAWFVAPATRMNPSLDYAQIRLGHNHNRGSNSGLLDARGFAAVVEAITWLDDSPALTKQEAVTIRQWFTEYLHWFTTSENGRLEHEASNNHGTWYLAQAIALARFVGNNELARDLAREDFARIAQQFAPDGSQPLEMVRTDGLSYCAFNLEAQFQVAKLAAPLGVDLWHFQATNGASLKQGLEFLRPYNANPQSWPHNQLKKMEPGFLQPLLDQAAQVWPAPGKPNSTQ